MAAGGERAAAKRRPARTAGRGCPDGAGAGEHQLVAAAAARPLRERVGQPVVELRESFRRLVPQGAPAVPRSSREGRGPVLCRRGPLHGAGEPEDARDGLCGEHGGVLPRRLPVDRGARADLRLRLDAGYDVFGCGVHRALQHLLRRARRRHRARRRGEASGARRARGRGRPGAGHARGGPRAAGSTRRRDHARPGARRGEKSAARPRGCGRGST